MLNEEYLNVGYIDTKPTPLIIETVHNKILVQEDEYRDGSECDTCNGTRHGSSAYAKSYIKCPACDGHGTLPDRYTMRETPCKNCDGSGEITCPDCGGLGIKKGKLLAPDTSEQRTSTGVILSIGPLFGKHVALDGTVVDLNKDHPYKCGQRVIYSNYAGTQIALSQKARLLSLQEHELLGRLGVLKNQDTSQPPVVRMTENK